MQWGKVEREEQIGGLWSPGGMWTEQKREDRWDNLEEEVRGWLDLLLEQDAERPVLLFQIKHSCPEFKTLLPQILWAQNR